MKDEVNWQSNLNSKPRYKQINYSEAVRQSLTLSEGKVFYFIEEAVL